MSALRQPVDAIVAVTRRCNARCIMCNVWQACGEDRLAAEHLRKLPASLRTINLSGGEPFLRNDLPQLLTACRGACPNAVVTISTNAIDAERTLAMMRDLRAIDPRLRLAVSLDGIGETHDRIRGRQGAFDAALHVVDTLLADGYDGLRLSMTVVDDNARQAAAVADLAEARQLELGIVAAQEVAVQLNHPTLPAQGANAESRIAFEHVLARWLRTWRPKQWLRAHFTERTWRYLCGERWDNLSRPGEQQFFLQSDATVYASSISGGEMGSLIDNDFASVWSSEQARCARAEVLQASRSSWMICTARQFYRSRPLGVGAWILRAKLRAHLRCLRLSSATTGRDA